MKVFVWSEFIQSFIVYSLWCQNFLNTNVKVVPSDERHFQQDFSIMFWPIYLGSIKKYIYYLYERSWCSLCCVFKNVVGLTHTFSIDIGKMVLVFGNMFSPQSHCYYKGIIVWLLTLVFDVGLHVSVILMTLH